MLPQFRLKDKIVNNGQGKAIHIYEVRQGDKPSIQFLQTPFQLLYVIHGSMSLVGMEILSYNEGETGKGFKPGITSLVGIHAHRNLSDSEKDRYNLYYLKNYTFLLDLEIGLRTLFR